MLSTFTQNVFLVSAACHYIYWHSHYNTISSIAARADWFPIDGWSGGRLVRAGSPALVPGKSASYPALLGSLPEGPIGQPESNSGFINGKVFLHMVSFQRISIWHLHMHLLQLFF
jgi:hypothetical protein